MIAFAKIPNRKRVAPVRHGAFLKMLPAIRRKAEFAFRCVPAEAREDLIEEVIANAFVAYCRLAKAGKAGIVGPTPLARYALAQIRTGRRVGNRLRIRDAMSGYAQYRKAFSVGSLDHYDREEDHWQEIILEDRAQGRRKSRLAKSTSRIGSACCHAGSGRSHWRWRPANRPAPPPNCSVSRQPAFPSFGSG